MSLNYNQEELKELSITVNDAIPVLIDGKSVKIYSKCKIPATYLISCLPTKTDRNSGIGKIFASYEFQWRARVTYFRIIFR